MRAAQLESAEMGGRFCLDPRPFAGPEAVLANLSRRTHWVATSNGRLLAIRLVATLANVGATVMRRTLAPGGKWRMADDDRTKLIPRRTAESAAMSANVKRAMAITAALNRLTFSDADEVRAFFSELIGEKVDDSFLLIPPSTQHAGSIISVGRNVFVNPNCTFYDLG